MATHPNLEPITKPTMYLQDAKELKKVFNRFDANGDGKISATEFADVMKDGFINLKEFADVIKALGSTTSTEEVSRMMHEIDTDKDGFINLEEFASFCKGKSAADGGDGELKEAFVLYNTDKNRLISASELHMVLNRLGEKCMVQDCTNMINK